MADFRQLALDFVLADDETKLTSLAQRAATEIESAPTNTNPVARWVEAVQPWMPSGNDDDAMNIDQSTPDWPARAKALEFLSRTLSCLSREVLKPSQIKLLVAFFGAMFDVDHKAGIMASATALSRIIAMKSFQAQSGLDIVQKVCVLKDDFARQIAKTRLAVYELLRSLLTDPAVASDLKQQQGPAFEFMHNLLQLCSSERDPDCLMVWFDILRFFSADYSPSKEILEEVYGAYKAYFPITLPRTSQSGLTPDTLKLQLRKCFCSNDAFAPLALPFLLGKLDQGDGVTVNVKVDVLRTIRACVEDYKRPEESVTPYVNRIWTCLKYEVRNGEVEDTIWATLEVLKAVASRLDADDLRDFTLTVTRECVGDLSSQIHCTAAGRLLVSILSAKAGAFVLMVSPAVMHIKENLRHPKSPTHSSDLLKILRIILETRLLLANVQMSEQERGDFAATDVVFKSLWADVYRAPVEAGSKAEASYDDIKLATEAAQGAGAVVCQQVIKLLDVERQNTRQSPVLLLPEETCAEICEALFSIAVRSWSDKTRKAALDELINESIKALRRAIEAFPTGFLPLLQRSVRTMRQSLSDSARSSAIIVQRSSSLLAFVGCSSFGPSLVDSMMRCVYLACALTSELLKALDEKANPDIWCAFAVGIQSVMHYFKDACEDANRKETRGQAPGHDDLLSQDSWLSVITQKYPVLSTIGVSPTATDTFEDGANVQEFESVTDLRRDFALIGLFICRQLYRRATKPTDNRSGPDGATLELSNDFLGSDRGAEYRYLCIMSDLGSFVVGEVTRVGIPLQFESFFLNLFRDDHSSLHALGPREDSASDGPAKQESTSLSSRVALGPLNTLSLGILKSLQPAGIARLYELGVAQQIIRDGTSLQRDSQNSQDLAVTRAILAILANKYELEKQDELMSFVKDKLEGALRLAASGPDAGERNRGFEQALSIFTLAGGLLRRCTGKQTRELLHVLRQAPSDLDAGHRLGHGLEVITAPQAFVTDTTGAVQKPLWMQKVYVELVKPLIESAVASSPEDRGPLVKMNMGVAALLMIKHMQFPIYEPDTGAIMRIAISTAQNLGAGSDANAALEVIKNILVEAPEAIQDHVASLIKLCTILFASASAATAPQRPEWVPKDYASAAEDAEARSSCGRLALEIAGGLPRVFESRHLLAYAPQMQRSLAAACGHQVRDVRKIARLARAAWAELK
ncbi:hypothetical protein HIM_07627 [Hirsutella minnesotensis 3608]|uniref:MMS19 nucleotide excision repair protein n=1 Tax=Hirsutella minnesotensis 3608 TaxID=1043627 RepID=A0A0F7ZN34_9HYPO|nr:hypothetical protein HIM_07627 [Hirsutella minnesotensis 3608]